MATKVNDFFFRTKLHVDTDREKVLHCRTRVASLVEAFVHLTSMTDPQDFSIKVQSNDAEKQKSEKPAPLAPSKPADDKKEGEELVCVQLYDPSQILTDVFSQKRTSS